jgi:hypothetical protein
VVCLIDQDPASALVLDAAKGRPERPSVAPTPWEPPALPCRLQVEPGLAPELFRDGRKRATLYDLSASAWAIVLPDGRFTGSLDAPSLLAFYGEGGELLASSDVSAWRDLEGVRSTLHALRTDPSSCGSSPRLPQK